MIPTTADGSLVINGVKSSILRAPHPFTVRVEHRSFLPAPVVGGQSHSLVFPGLDVLPSGCRCCLSLLKRELVCWFDEWQVLKGSLIFPRTVSQPLCVLCITSSYSQENFDQVVIDQVIFPMGQYSNCVFKVLKPKVAVYPSLSAGPGARHSVSRVPRAHLVLQ